MPMVSMQLDDEERNEQMGDDEDAESERYPYGLCLHLDDGSLAKLKLTQPPKVGSTMTITARVKVVSTRMSEDEGGEPENSSDWQITDLMVGEDKSRPDAASLLYS